MVDPHLPKEDRSSNLVVDNPLSQNPGICPRQDFMTRNDEHEILMMYPLNVDIFCSLPIYLCKTLNS